jgi:ATP-binding cassette, subfamily B, bacterial PglK
MGNYKRILFLSSGKKYKKLFVLIFFILISSVLEVIGVGVIVPYLSIVSGTYDEKEFFEILSLLQWNEVDLIISSSILLLLLFVFKSVLSMWLNYLIVKFVKCRSIELRESLMLSYQSMSYEDYTLRNSSEYVHNIHTLVNQFSNGVMLNGMKVIADSIISISILLYLLLLSPVAFTLLAFLLVFFLVLYNLFIRSRLTEKGKESNNSADGLLKSINEGILGLKEIRILGKQAFFFSKMSKNTHRYANINAYLSIISLVPRYILEVCIVLFITGFVVSSYLLKVDFNLLMPVLAVFGVSAIKLLPSINSISTFMTKYRFHKDTINRLYVDLRGNKPPTLLSNANYDKGNSFKYLKLSRVSYKYPLSRKKVLLDINIKIKAGYSVGFIGGSGSGKTTLMNIILGLITPDSGSVELDGVPISKDLRKWQDKIAYLPQDIFLIDDTVRNNIALGVNFNEIDEGLILKSARASKIEQMINNLPNGLDTIIGERGARLSGGQKQRIAIARSFYHKKDVLAFDESTSALDLETENEIVSEIQKYKGKKTIIIIAHRLSTLRNCDVIYSIEGGKISFHGAPKDVL